MHNNIKYVYKIRERGFIFMQLVTDFSQKDTDLLKDESRLSGKASHIAYPTSTKDVSDIVKDYSSNITIQGNLTGLAGGGVPDGGLILSTKKMDNIISLNEKEVHLQSGILLTELNKFLDPKDLFLPPDPTEKTACIGGMVACNASGARTLKYGSIRPWVSYLKIVLANGDILEINRGVHFANEFEFELVTNQGTIIKGLLPEIETPNVKNAAGYYIKPNMDLIDLFIGSEGTLGIITEVKLKLLSKPERICAVTTFFNSEKNALDYIYKVRKSEADPAAIEYFDENALELLRNERMQNPAFTELQELPDNYFSAVYTEIHVNNKGDQDKFLALIAKLIKENGGNTSHTWLAVNNTDIEQLRYFRHATPEIVNLTIDKRKRTYPDLTKLGTDMAVPDEYLYDVMEMYHNDLEAANLEYVIFGHIGDNHLHVNIIPRNYAEYQLGKALYLDWANQITSWGGTVSAEHGIGKFKREFLAIMYDKEDINKMRKLKHIFDKNDKLCPGNLFEVGEN
jgi:D-lactate dehydrogenase (cytochrome)